MNNQCEYLYYRSLNKIFGNIMYFGSLITYHNDTLLEASMIPINIIIVYNEHNYKFCGTCKFRIHWNKLQSITYRSHFIGVILTVIN